MGHRASFLVLAEGVLDKIWIVCLEQFIQNEMPDPALLSNFCRIAAAFERTDWVCNEVRCNLNQGFHDTAEMVHSCLEYGTDV